MSSYAARQRQAGASAGRAESDAKEMSVTDDPTKQVVARYWGDLAPKFDEGLHIATTDAERRAWARIVDLLAGDAPRDVLDVGCGTGFLALLFARHGHSVTGTDIAPEMIAEAERKAAREGVSARFAVADAEALDLADGSFDLVVSRHLLWTLTHPDRAVRDWARVVRPGGRIAVIDGQWNVDRQVEGQRRENSAMRQAYGDAVVAALPCYGGAPSDDVARLLTDAGLQKAQSDMLDDLVAAQQARLAAEGREPVSYIRYVVFAEKAAG
jgi:ubiquinone/menaquinone biosynthesis C-methylase UbiE